MAVRVYSAGLLEPATLIALVAIATACDETPAENPTREAPTSAQQIPAEQRAGLAKPPPEPDYSKLPLPELATRAKALEKETAGIDSLKKRIRSAKQALELWKLWADRGGGKEPRRLAGLRRRLKRDQKALKRREAREARAELLRERREERKQAALERKRAAEERRAEREARRQERDERRARRAYAPLLCCDGSSSPSCTCGGPRRGCCSHHGGVCGCSE